MFISLANKKSEIHYIRFGNGDKLMIAFHGFGEDAEKFRWLEPSLANHYTTIAVDLPFHGSTLWNKEEFFDKEDVATIIHEILRHEGKDRFSLMGYSLGGKIVMLAIQMFASQIDGVILAAPDGIKTNVWYNIGVYPEWGRRLFRRFVKRPRFVFSLARFLNRVGVLSDSMQKFLKLQTDTEEKRQRIHDVWISVKDVEPDLPRVKQLLNDYHIPSFLFIGKYDRVITPSLGNRFLKGLHDCHYILLEKGHNLITESFNGPLKAALSL